MKNRIKELFKYDKLSLIMCIITLVLGIGFYTLYPMEITIKGKLMRFFAGFLPFFIFLLITILAYRSKGKYKNILKSYVLTLFLIFYYFMAAFVCVLITGTEPITDPKYYNHYVTGKRLEKAFPNKIPRNAKNVEFYFVQGVLQGGTSYSLYYIDDNMNKEEFDKKYKNKALWIGHKEEYTKNNGLFSGAFSNTPAHYENENDYIIYLIEGYCDDSGYCNHGDFLFASFNEKTNEVIFKSNQW